MSPIGQQQYEVSFPALILLVINPTCVLLVYDSLTSRFHHSPKEP